MANRARTAGEKLRQRFDEALAAENEDSKDILAWTDHEITALEAAAAAADCAEVLRDRWNVISQDPDTSVNLLTKLSSELRALDRQVTELLKQVSITPLTKPERNGYMGRPGRA